MITCTLCVGKLVRRSADLSSLIPIIQFATLMDSRDHYLILAAVYLTMWIMGI